MINKQLHFKDGKLVEMTAAEIEESDDRNFKFDLISTNERTLNLCEKLLWENIVITTLFLISFTINILQSFGVTICE